MFADTIAAVSTSLGESAIGVVRLSGPDAPAIAAACFRHGRKLRARPAAALTSHRVFYGAIVDLDSSNVIDEVLLVRMAAPRSYTREEVVEISCHGGPAAVQQILALCLRLGARHANPGEFTLRAFANGRIDLAQAEAVAAIVSARTSSSLDLAVSELRGRMRQRLQPARDLLVETLAYLDAAADFPDDEIPPFDAWPALNAAHTVLDEVAQSGRAGRLYQDGVRIALVGRPNVGKSSLLNALLRFERAIVTPIAGTTRDVISETISLRGIPATLLDTAGIGDSSDVIEQLGIDRSRQAARASALVVLVLDRSMALTADDVRVADLLRERRDSVGNDIIVVLNKADLPDVAGRAARHLFPMAPCVELSAVTGQGLLALEDALYAAASGLAGESAEPQLVTERQLNAIQRAAASVAAGRAALEDGLPLDLVAVDVRDALMAVGEVTGENVSEAVLDEIFRRFCIGK